MTRLAASSNEALVTDPVELSPARGNSSEIFVPSSCSRTKGARHAPPRAGWARGVQLTRCWLAHLGPPRSALAQARGCSVARACVVIEEERETLRFSSISATWERARARAVRAGKLAAHLHPLAATLRARLEESSEACLLADMETPLSVLLGADGTSASPLTRACSMDFR